MSHPPRAPKRDAADSPGPDTLKQAAHWFVLLASGEATDTDRSRWMAWRAADATHELAWQRAEAVVAPFAAVAGPHAGISRATLERATQPPSRRRVLGSMAGVLAVGTLGWQGWLRSDLSAGERTAVGEVRALTLTDGSVLHLDTDTAIDLQMDDRARVVRLRHGRIHVVTGHATGAMPPFQVQTAHGTVQALGTRFTVMARPNETHVAVVADRVAVQAGGQADTVLVASGDAVRFDRQGVIAHGRAQPQDSGWARGMLVMHDMPLGDFIAELARYRREPLACDPDVRHMRISGTYPLTDVDKALASLARSLPVRVEIQGANDPPGSLVLRAR